MWLRTLHQHNCVTASVTPHIGVACRATPRPETRPGTTGSPDGSHELHRGDGLGPDRGHQRGQPGRRVEHDHARGPDDFPLRLDRGG